MYQVQFVHGGPAFDAGYPDGIPTSVRLTTTDGTVYELPGASASGSDPLLPLVMYPSGHARNSSADLHGILDHKFAALAALVTEGHGATAPTRAIEYVERLQGMQEKTAADMMDLYNFDIAAAAYDDTPLE
jgi:2-methylcitrate dehydratase